jgi:hypothetical protein
VARKPIAGARLIVRILAVTLLLSGLTAGFVIGIQKQPTESLSLQSASEAETKASSVSATPAPDTNVPQRRPAAAELKLAQEESSQSKQAQSQAAVRAQQVSDSIADRARAAADDAKQRIEDSLGPGGGLPPDAPTDCLSYLGVKQIGCSLLVAAGFEVGQMSCLDKLWTKESHWNVKAVNSSSGATGIPQALPGEKMAEYGSDWRTNPVPQIKWGLNYIKGRYSTPCGAWGHSTNTGWY